jgi:hypothetical protein
MHQQLPHRCAHTRPAHRIADPDNTPAGVHSAHHHLLVHAAMVAQDPRTAGSTH